MSILQPIARDVRQVVAQVSVESDDPRAHVELSRWWLQECYEHYCLPLFGHLPEGDFTKIITYGTHDPIDREDHGACFLRSVRAGGHCGSDEHDLGVRSAA